MRQDIEKQVYQRINQKDQEKKQEEEKGDKMFWEE